MACRVQGAGCRVQGAVAAKRAAYAAAAAAGKGSEGCALVLWLYNRIPVIPVNYVQGPIPRVANPMKRLSLARPIKLLAAQKQRCPAPATQARACCACSPRSVLCASMRHRVAAWRLPCLSGALAASPLAARPCSTPPSPCCARLTMTLRSACTLALARPPDVQTSRVCSPLPLPVVCFE
jgi:hypothetical protein